jgi:DnaK suppressor protein
LVEEYRELTKPIAPDDAIGRISRMDAINNKSVTEATLRQAEEKLNKLQYVLTRIGKEGFGFCLKCKKQIPIGRILIRPESQHCVQCAV